MGLYKRYVEWAGKKIAEYIYIPLYEKLYNSETVLNVSEKLVEINDKVAEKTGYDYLEKCREEEEYAKHNPEKAALKKVAKSAAKSIIMGGVSDYNNLKEE